MSVESAKFDLYREMVNGTAESIAPALDRLIDEAQAAMPCAATWVTDNLIFQNSGVAFQQCPEGGQHVCVPCAAKAKLAQVPA